MGSSMSISRSLQGAIPGLTMTFSDGKPNRGATVRIRGAENSIDSRKLRGKILERQMRWQSSTRSW